MLAETISSIEKQVGTQLLEPLHSQIAPIFEISNIENQVNLHLFVGITIGWLVQRILLGDAGTKDINI